MHRDRPNPVDDHFRTMSGKPEDFGVRC